MLLYIHQFICRNRSRSNIPCFLAGDLRANEQQLLLTLHTIFFREHNRIASQLHVINPEWTDEMVYQVPNMLFYS